MFDVGHDYKNLVVKIPNGSPDFDRLVLTIMIDSYVYEW